MNGAGCGTGAERTYVGNDVGPGRASSGSRRGRSRSVRLGPWGTADVSGGTVVRFEPDLPRGAGARGTAPADGDVPGRPTPRSALQDLGEKRSRVAASAPRASRTMDTHRPDRWLPVASSA